MMEVEAAKLIAGALMLAPTFGAALGLGAYFKSYNEALARNPEVKSGLEAKFWICLAFIEALAIIPIGLSAAVIYG